MGSPKEDNLKEVSYIWLVRKRKKAVEKVNKWKA